MGRLHVLLVGLEIQRNLANRRRVPIAHRFCRSSYSASSRLYVAQRMRGGFGGKSYSSSVAPLHLSCRREARHELTPREVWAKAEQLPLALGRHE
jgi:hypothetical protein